MKFRFKVQEYQTEAVNAVVNVFKGQPFSDMVKYTRDLGIKKRRSDGQGSMWDSEYAGRTYNENDDGFENANIVLSDEQLLENIQKIQQDNNIKVQDKLVEHLGRCSLNIEMETGTGKTYVYIKTIFELNQRYGWSKFIIVVPSIAIREGVKKSFDQMEEHFMEHYGKKARYFIYDSDNLTRIDAFASANDIQVMIINAQAFNAVGKINWNTSLEKIYEQLENTARGKQNRRIYAELDEFQSRRPISVISKNRPILILDEPQKLGGEATQNSLRLFNPLFCLSYSATHKKQNNLVYVLDALDAYNKKLVKKIEVKGFEVKNLRGTDSYMFLEKIIVSKDKPPMAKLEFEIDYNKSINRETKLVKKNDDLFYRSKEMQQYKGYLITDINPFNNTISFMNGVVIKAGEVIGDVSESDLRRIQIRETILSHFEKERKLFKKKIKCLSLFFIDEVAKYRDYSREDEQGEYARIFEEEYNKLLNDYIRIDEPEYAKYLQSINVKDTHKGYFSIDKKSGKMIDSKEKGEEGSDDISAYELILKNKERLLSFDEPTRFIFSHSALREGWDNPNIFQICTLKHSNSSVAKRQEVGRGLRICVNFMGERVDKSYPATNFHDVNKLTVIATDSYAEFVGDLQKEIKEALYDGRPTKATIDYFKGKNISDGVNTIVIDNDMASDIQSYLRFSGYIDRDNKLTEEYFADRDNNSFKEMPKILAPYEESIHKIVQGIFDEKALAGMVENGNSAEIKNNSLNDNFYKKEFQNLWNYINHKYSYTVDFNSEELIDKAISEINNCLNVNELQYVVTVGEQKREMERNQLNRGDSFQGSKTRNESLSFVNSGEVKYDLVGKLARNTTLTRKTIVKILKGLEEKKFEMFKINPEEFIKKVSKMINEQKATMIVDHITYNKTNGRYDNDIFTNNQSKIDFKKAFKTKKHIEDFVITDGIAENSIEIRFADDLEKAEEVCVYAKLPKGFKIPTPVGDYAPDWAIAFKEGSVKHIYFVAETKGSMDSLELRGIEKAKTACVRRLFNVLQEAGDVRYEVVDNYQNLLNIINNID
ncbi:MAG: type III restriction-modification system endonuclease [Candidatus Caccovivens sp.]